jgi:hypothetical protein
MNETVPLLANRLELLGHADLARLLRGAIPNLAEIAVYERETIDADTSKRWRETGLTLTSL